MKILYRTRNSNEIMRAVLVLFILGTVLGIIISSLFKGVYFEQIEIFSGDYFNKLEVLDIDYKSLFKFVVWDRYKIFVSVLVLSVTIIGIPYLGLLVLYAGGSAGFLLSVAVMQWGGKGILVFLAYLFPQYLIYIPAALFTIIQAYRVCIGIHFGIPISKKGNIKFILERVPAFFLLGLLLLLGCFAETYLNSPILQKLLLPFIT